jgi:ribosomal protein S12 methylthiotransferase
MDVLEVLRDEPKMCKYLDLPVQHISTNQLTAMRRNITREQTEELISKIRKEVPGITLRTTMIVGYPGETEADFGELVDFVTPTKFDRLGVFTYSEEEGTYSAEKLQNDVPEEEKERRRDEIMEIQSAISLAKNEEKVEKTFRVIIDRVEGDYFVGRTEGDSPEVDNEVLISSKEKLTVGEFYNVAISDADEYDLYGKVVN